MFDRICEAISVALLAATVIIGFLAVIYRYVLGSALSWSFEVLVGLLVYMTFLGGYLALRQGAHLRIDILVVRFPLPAQVVIFTVNQLAIVAVGVVMVVWGFEQAQRFGGRSSLVLEVPMVVFYAILPIAGAGIALEAGRQFVAGLLAALRGEPPYHPAADTAEAMRSGGDI